MSMERVRVCATEGSSVLTIDGPPDFDLPTHRSPSTRTPNFEQREARPPTIPSCVMSARTIQSIKLPRGSETVRVLTA